MSQVLVATLSRSPIARAGYVTAAIFLLLGLATGAVPLHCLSGACAALPVPDAATLVAPLGFPPAAKAVSSPGAAPMQVAAVAPAPVVAPDAGPTLTKNEVVASTFALLKVDLTPASAAPAPLVAPATAVASNDATSDSDSGLRTRVVHTTAIRVDTSSATGQPKVEVAEAMPADASDAIDSAVGPEPAPAKATAIAYAEPPAPKAKVKSAPAATIKGQGANIRSTPSKSSSKVLFALNGGEKVTVLSSSHGWLQIKDDRGRTGWVYGDFVARG